MNTGQARDRGADRLDAAGAALRPALSSPGEAFELASPLAAGWGMEVGMTIDVLRAGLKVVEVEIDLRHRATGSRSRCAAASGGPAARRDSGARSPRPGAGRAQGFEGLRWCDRRVQATPR